MNTSKLADISEIVSSIAIVITLAFLTIQMKQNTLAIETTTRYTAQVNYSEFLSQMINNPDALIALYNHENMTNEGAVQAFMTMTLLFRARESDWAQYQTGVLDEATWLRIERALGAVLQTSGARNYWINYGTRRFSPEFVKRINKIVENTPVFEGALEDSIKTLFLNPDEFKQANGSAY